MSDLVNHPQHYTKLPHEVIEITRGMEFCAGNVLKYLMRAPFKGQMLEDLEKAKWYLEDMFSCNAVRAHITKEKKKMIGENADALRAMGYKNIARAITNSMRGYRALAVATINIQIKELEGEENDKA